MYSGWNQAGGAAATTAAAIAVREVSHAFPAAGGEPVLALDGVSFEVPRGQFLALVGASGCGKTTILNMAAGLVRPLAGEVRVAGQRVCEPRRDTGYMFARDGLLPWRCAQDNVEVGLEIRGVPARERSRRALQLLELVGLAGFARALPRQLSQGMRQRVAIARTLAIDPSTLLMDEPFAALDAQTREILQEELLGLMQRPDERKTVVFITHSIDEAILLGDRVAVMTPRPGRIKEMLDMPFGWPRDVNAVRADPHFAELRNHIWNGLRPARLDAAAAFAAAGE